MAIECCGVLSQQEHNEVNYHQSKYVCMLTHFSHVQLFATLWIVVCQAPLSMGFSRQEYWSELLCPPPRGLSNPGLKPTSLTFLALAGRFFATNATWEAPFYLSFFSFTSSFLKSKRMNEVKTQIIYDFSMERFSKGAQWILVFYSLSFLSICKY